jgi:SAM-dependent methyltransferase
MQFLEYSKYYDLLYKDKDYEKETSFIVKQLHDLKKTNGKILEIGCGTGRHAELLVRNGYSVHGIDVSAQMIEMAKKREGENLVFEKKSIDEVQGDEQYDIIISLFHVVSYFHTNEAQDQLFKKISKLIKKDGVVLFDYWYGPGVLTDKPSVRKKIVSSEEMEIVRVSTPAMHINENMVDVHFDLLVKDKKNHTEKNMKELHKMRYLFLPEIVSRLDLNDFTMLKTTEWLSDNLLSDKSWYGFTVAQKK